MDSIESRLTLDKALDIVWRRKTVRFDRLDSEVQHLIRRFLKHRSEYQHIIKEIGVEYNYKNFSVSGKDFLTSIGILNATQF